MGAAPGVPVPEGGVWILRANSKSRRTDFKIMHLHTELRNGLRGPLFCAAKIRDATFVRLIRSNKNHAWRRALLRERHRAL
jgi:hypothetical protein